MAVQNVVINVEGMHCGNCAGKVKGALEKTAGVQSAEVDLEGKKARISFDPAATNPGVLMGAVKSVGFKPTGFAAG
jgi:copper chaperone CopZ